jgi:hypothetical protein
MCGGIPPLPRYTFMAWCSVTAQGQLYLTFIVLYSGINRKRRAVVNDELERMWNEVALICFNVLSVTLLGGTEKDRMHYNPPLDREPNLGAPEYSGGQLPLNLNDLCLCQSVYGLITGPCLLVHVPRRDKVSVYLLVKVIVADLKWYIHIRQYHSLENPIHWCSRSVAWYVLKFVY